MRTISKKMMKLKMTKLKNLKKMINDDQCYGKYKTDTSMKYGDDDF